MKILLTSNYDGQSVSLVPSTEELIERANMKRESLLKQKETLSDLYKLEHDEVRKQYHLISPKQNDLLALLQCSSCLLYNKVFYSFFCLKSLKKLILLRAGFWIGKSFCAPFSFFRASITIWRTFLTSVELPLSSSK